MIALNASCQGTLSTADMLEDVAPVTFLLPADLADLSSSSGVDLHCLKGAMLGSLR